MAITTTVTKRTISQGTTCKKAFLHVTEKAVRTTALLPPSDVTVRSFFFDFRNADFELACDQNGIKSSGVLPTVNGGQNFFDAIPDFIAANGAMGNSTGSPFSDLTSEDFVTLPPGL